MKSSSGRLEKALGVSMLVLAVSAAGCGGGGGGSSSTGMQVASSGPSSGPTSSSGPSSAPTVTSPAPAQPGSPGTPGSPMTANGPLTAAGGGPRQSSTVALSGDDGLLVNTNQDANTITLTSVKSDPPSKIAEIPVGREPRSVAVMPDGSRAFVANAIDGTISDVSLSTNAVSKTFAAGTEPVACCLTPNGTLLYVANEISGDVMVFSTSNDTLVKTIDLSSLGTHPYAIAITNNGDAIDTDETVFVSLFFGVNRPGKDGREEGQDDQKEGHVAVIPVATNVAAAAPIVLAPLANSGFTANGSTLGQIGTSGGTGGTAAVGPANPQTAASTINTGCFPNQLAAIAIHPTNKKAYVASTAASPNGPFRFDVNVQGLVSVFDTGSKTEILAAQTSTTARAQAPLNLNQNVGNDTGTVPKLFYSNPVAMAWRPDGSDAWVACQQGDVVVRMTVDSNGTPSINAPLAKTAAGAPADITHVDLQNASFPELGFAPRGIAINRRGDRAYVSSFVSRSISSIDISKPTAPAVVGTSLSTALPQAGTQAAIAHLGAQLFFTGRGQMSNNAWGSCACCHPNGLTDNVTWMFNSGPRQTIPLDGTFSKTASGDHRLMNWSAVADEIQDFELNTRTVSGGLGNIRDDREYFVMHGSAGFGGSLEGSDLVEQFDQGLLTTGTTNTLAQGAALPNLTGLGGNRRDFGCAQLADGRIVIVGGRVDLPNGTTQLVPAADSALVFDPRANTIKRLPAMITPRHSLGVVAVKVGANVRVYAIGGYTDAAGTTLSQANEFIDTGSLSAWSSDTLIPTAIAQFGCAVAGGINSAEPQQLIHCACGNTGSDATPAPSSLLQVFTPAIGGGTWATPAFASPLTARRGCGAATILRGAKSHVFVIGGDTGGAPLPTVEEYTFTAGVAAKTATPISQMPDFPGGNVGSGGRTRAAIAANGASARIYVFGGLTSNGVASVETSSILELSVADNGPTAGAAGTPSGLWTVKGALLAARFGLAVNNPPPVVQLAPVSSSNRDPNADAIAVWTELKVRSNLGQKPAALASSIANGRLAFGTPGIVTAFPGASCATCHGGGKWTRSTVDYTGAPTTTTGAPIFGTETITAASVTATFSQPNTGTPAFGVLLDVGTFQANGNSDSRVNEVRLDPADVSHVAVAGTGAGNTGNGIAPFGPGFNIPSLLSVSATAPYFYNGRAPDLTSVLDGSVDQFGTGAWKGVHSVPATFTVSGTSISRQDLINFLKSIDGTTPTFP